MIPIVMTAFGTTSDAVNTYAFLDGIIKKSLPNEEIIWASSSRKVAHALRQGENPSAIHLEQALAQLADRGVRQVVVQSLHLFPGTEFHRIQATTRHSGLECAIGLPLFTSPRDHDHLGTILRPIVGTEADRAILVLGHGTNHPAWTAYYALEKILRRRFGDRLFVGVVEKSPDSSHLVDEIAAAGYSKVNIVPLFLVSGLHFHRDIIGDGPESWLSRFTNRGIGATCTSHGLGRLPGVAELIIDHITAARDTLMTGR